MATSQETPLQKEPHNPSMSTSATLTAQSQTRHPEVKSAAQHGTPDTTTTKADLTPQSGASSIEITTRNDLSFLYRVIRLIIKPIRPHLVSPPKTPFPEGSPRLDPPKKRNIVIKETKLESVWMYHMHALGPDYDSQGRIEKAQGDEKSNDLEQETSRSSSIPSETANGANKGRGFERKHRVYYFSGGSFQSPPSGEHWRFIAQLAQDLAGHRSSVTFPGKQRSVDPESDAKVELIMVSPPLAPKSPAIESLRILRNWLRRVMDDAVQRGETVSLMGDSSGANMITSLGFWAVREYRPGTSARDLKGEQRDEMTPRETSRRNFPLTSLFSISGPMDLTNSSPEIPHVDTLEVVLTAKLTKDVADVYCGHDKQRASQYAPTPLSSPDVSPLFQPDEAFTALRDKKVNIHGVYGTHDVLAPSGIDFMKKCQRLGVKGRWLVWEGQMHCFPLAGGGDTLGVREGREARKYVETVLRGDAEMED